MRKVKTVKSVNIRPYNRTLKCPKVRVGATKGCFGFFRSGGAAVEQDQGTLKRIGTFSFINKV